MNELIGRWSSEDGSGYSMIAGQAVVFNKSGSEFMSSWGSYPDDDGNEVGYANEENFEWRRTGKSAIQVRLSQGKWTNIQYLLRQYKSYSQGLELKQVNNPTQIWHWSLFRS